MLKVVRLNSWWHTIPPQVMGWVYFWALAWTPTLLTYQWKVVGLFFITLLSISSFGYLLNDFFDVKSDQAAGKINMLLPYSLPVRALMVIFPLAVGTIAWVLIPFIRPGATILLFLQVVALVLYSAPPLRLKGRGIWGVLADAFYGHINPVLITLTFFLRGYSKDNKMLLLLLVILVCTALKGVRNILLHQIDDRKKDRKAGVQTFAVRNGGLFCLNFINKLLPLEILFTLLLVGLISVTFPPFFLSILLFTVVTYLKFSAWKLSYLPQRQLRFKLLYFMNDYYEGWMPVFFLLLLSLYLPWLLPLHLILFPSFAVKLWQDLRTIRQNFKTEHDY